MQEIFLVYFFLIFLWILTTFIAFLPLGKINIFCGIFIAALKASLILLYFMRVKGSKTKIFLICSSAMWFLALFSRNYKFVVVLLSCRTCFGISINKQPAFKMGC